MQAVVRPAHHERSMSRLSTAQDNVQAPCLRLQAGPDLLISQGGTLGITTLSIDRCAAPGPNSHFLLSWRGANHLSRSYI